MQEDKDYVMSHERLKPPSASPFTSTHFEKFPNPMELLLKNWMYELVPVHPTVKRRDVERVRGEDTGLPDDYDFEFESRDWEGVSGFSIPKGWGFVRDDEDTWVRTGMKQSILALKVRLMLPLTRNSGRRVFAYPVVSSRITGKRDWLNAIRRVIAHEEAHLEHQRTNGI